MPFQDQTKLPSDFTTTPLGSSIIDPTAGISTPQSATENLLFAILEEIVLVRKILIGVASFSGKESLLSMDESSGDDGDSDSEDI